MHGEVREPTAPNKTTAHFTPTSRPHAAGRREPGDPWRGPRGSRHGSLAQTPRHRASPQLGRASSSPCVLPPPPARGSSAPGAISPLLLSAASPAPAAPSRGRQRRRSRAAAGLPARSGGLALTASRSHLPAGRAEGRGTAATGAATGASSWPAAAAEATESDGQRLHAQPGEPRGAAPGTPSARRWKSRSLIASVGHSYTVWSPPPRDGASELGRKRPLPRDSAGRGKAAHRAPLLTGKFLPLADLSPSAPLGDGWQQANIKNPKKLPSESSCPSVPAAGRRGPPSHEGTGHPATGAPRDAAAPHLPPRRPGTGHPPSGRRWEKGAGALTCPSERSPPRVPLLPIVGAAAAVIP